MKKREVVIKKEHQEKESEEADEVVLTKNEKKVNEISQVAIKVVVQKCR
jgi:hypothetical protein